MRQQPEKAEQAAIVQLLRTIGARVYVLGTRRRKGDYPGTNQTPGLPDLYAFLPAGPHRAYAATTLWVEVKAPRGRLSAEQRAFAEACEAARQRHVVGGLDEVVVFLTIGGWLKA